MTNDLRTTASQTHRVAGLPAETEWVEFKQAKNNSDPQMIGEYLSALSQRGRPQRPAVGCIVCGVKDRHSADRRSNYRSSRRQPRKAQGRRSANHD